MRSWISWRRNKPFAGLGCDGDAAPLQRLFIAPQIAARWREKAMSPGRQARRSPAVRSRMRLAADQPRAHLGDGLGFAVALLFVPKPCRPHRRRQYRVPRRKPLLSFGVERVERGKTRLAVSADSRLSKRSFT